MYSLASSFSGLVSGLILGAVGSLLPTDLRIALASLLAVGAVILGTVEFIGYRLRLLQCDHETPQQWVNLGPFLWAIRNGLTLGCGATSRIGFWLWYTIPFGAFLIAQPELSAILYGTYGIIRGMAVWGIILSLHRYPEADYEVWLTRQVHAARRIAAGQLLLLGITLVIAVGF